MLWQEIWEAMLVLAEGNSIDKLRIIVNNKDGFTPEQMLRVHGSLMLAVGKVSAFVPPDGTRAKIFESPDALPVYIGTFYDWKFHDELRPFFPDKDTLAHDVAQLPMKITETVIDEMMRKICAVKANACLLDHLTQRRNSKELRKLKQKKWLVYLQKNIKSICLLVGEKYGIPRTFFPTDEELLTIAFNEMDLTKNPQALDTERLAVLDQTMNVDLVILKRCLQVIVYTKPSSRWADSETIASANNAVGSRARENSVAGEIQQIVALSEVGHGTDADPIKSREVEAVADADPIKSREVEDNSHFVVNLHGFGD